MKATSRVKGTLRMRWTKKVLGFLADSSGRSGTRKEGTSGSARPCASACALTFMTWLRRFSCSAGMRLSPGSSSLRFVRTPRQCPLLVSGSRPAYSGGYATRPGPRALAPSTTEYAPIPGTLLTPFSTTRPGAPLPRVAPIARSGRAPSGSAQNSVTESGPAGAPVCPPNASALTRYVHSRVPVFSHAPFTVTPHSASTKSCAP